MGTTNILDLNNRVSELEKSVSGGDSSQANKKDIATEFSATTAYTAGCFVYHDGKLYQFNTDHAAGAWDATDVVEANVTDQIVSNKAAIDALDVDKPDKSDIAPEFNTTTAYAAGDLCYYEGTLYEFNQEHVAGAWNSTEVDEKNLAEVITDGLNNILAYTMIKEITADGTKTYKQLINELLSDISFALRSDYIISVDSAYRMYLMTGSSSTKTFSSVTASTGSIVVRSITYKPSDTSATIYVGNTINNNGFTATDYSDVASTATNKLRLYVRSR